MRKRASDITKGESTVYSIDFTLQDGQRQDILISTLATADMTVESIELFAPKPGNILLYSIALNGFAIQEARIRDRADTVSLTNRFGLDAFYCRPLIMVSRHCVGPDDDLPIRIVAEYTGTPLVRDDYRHPEPVKSWVRLRGHRIHHPGRTA